MTNGQAAIVIACALAVALLWAACSLTHGFADLAY